MKFEETIRVAQMCKKKGNSSKEDLEGVLRDAQVANVTTFECLRAGIFLDAVDGNPHAVERWLREMELGDFSSNQEPFTVSLHRAKGRTRGDKKVAVCHNADGDRVLTCHQRDILKIG